ncbi:MAG: ATP-binding cassette domain-containing protein [Porphyrobacter sp.]|nr:ATP-binding cassette domain-containing protein [Porphyrobacter sp.]
MESPARPGQMAALARFARFLAKGGGRRFAFALGLLVLGGLTEGVSILLVIPLLSLAGRDAGAGLPLPDWIPGDLHVSLAAALAGLVGLIALHGFFTRAKNIYLADLLFDLLNRLRLDLFAAIGALRWDHLARHRPSDLHHLLTGDVERIYAAAMAVMMLLQAGILLVIYLAVAWIISPAMMLAAGALGLAILGILTPLRRRATRFGLERTVNKRDQYRTVSEFLGGLKTAKIHGAEGAFEQRLAENLAKVHDEAVGYMRLTSLGTIVSQLVSAVAVAALVLAGVEMLGLALPELVAFLLLLMRIAPRFTGMQTQSQQLLVNLTVFTDVEAFRARCAAEAEAPGTRAAEPLPLRSELRCEGVSYAYAGAGGTPALDAIDLVIPAGAVTALVGPSGSGKSTAADLLCGLLVPQSGTIRIDGAPLTAERARHWRASIAYVPQEPFLLAGDVADNLRLGRPEAGEAELWAALEAAGAAGFVRRLPQGIATPLGENGSRLSGGQRQRLALARALAMKPQLLVLDEATSALDWESQAAITRAIAALRGKVTVLVIAHRLAMVALADQVIALRDGRVIEAGSFAALSRGDGPVARLVAAEASGGHDAPEPACDENLTHVSVSPRPPAKAVANQRG